MGDSTLRNFLLLSAFIIIIFMSCASVDIKEKNIDKIDIKLVSSSNNTVSEVLPGSEYDIELIISSNGENISRPNYNDIILTSPNSSFLILEQNERTLRVKANENVFYIISKGNYQLSIEIQNNQFPSKVQFFPIDLNSRNYFDYSGFDGSPGDSGSNGENAHEGSNFANQKVALGVIGESGEQGFQGNPGENGNDVTFLVSYYNISDSNYLCLFDLNSKEIIMTSLQPITIDASGGIGGTGGRGGNGGAGRTITSNGRPKIKGSMGLGGIGGDGGIGGNGGNIRILYYNQSILKFINAKVQGGAGGKVGLMGLGVDSGKVGITGRPGEDGLFLTELISYDKAKKLLSEINDPYFQIENIID